MRGTWLSSNRLLVPTTGRLPKGLWMHSACRPSVVLANNAMGWVAKSSVRLLPGTRQTVTWPLDFDQLRRLRQLVPGWDASDRVVMMKPSDARRARVLVMPLDENGHPLAFVKLTMDQPNLVATDLIARLVGSTSLILPKVLRVAGVDDWWATVEEPIPQLPHRPARLSSLARHDLVARIQSLGAGGAPGLAMSHGDFGPWNVRRMTGGRIAILDWEYAGLAPFGTDELWHAITFSLSRSRRAGSHIGRQAQRNLEGFYTHAQLEAAARFLATRWDDGEPTEIRSDVPKSASLLRFERRLIAALAEFDESLAARGAGYE